MTRDEALDLFAVRPTRAVEAAQAPIAFDPRDHRCHCGAWGSFGHEHSSARPGRWYCAAHDPARRSAGA